MRPALGATVAVVKPFARQPAPLNVGASMCLFCFHRWTCRRAVVDGKRIPRCGACKRGDRG